MKKYLSIVYLMMLSITSQSQGSYDIGFSGRHVNMLPPTYDMQFVIIYIEVQG